MLNPILKDKSYATGFFIAWGAVGLVHLFILLYFYSYGFLISISETFIFNSLFGILSIGIWYPVYFSDLEKKKILNFLTNHLASSSLAVGIWLWLSYVLLTFFFEDSLEYIAYLNSSIPWRVGLGFLFYFIVVSNYYLIMYYNNFQDKALRESELKGLIKESELNSLKSQINPHFLFNSLNSISSLTMVSPQRAQEMVINLSDFLRYTLSHKKESLTTFENELSNIERYLKIEKIRFGKRLHVEKSIDDTCKTYYLPGLILQPILENAVKYGVYESTDRSDVSISACCRPDLLEVVVKNDYDPDFTSKKGEGIGLKNVQSRLRIQYSREDLVKIIKTDTTFEITLRFPQNTI